MGSPSDAGLKEEAKDTASSRAAPAIPM